MFFTMTYAKVWRILYVVYTKNPRRGYRCLGKELILFFILAGIIIPLSLLGFYLYFVLGEVPYDETLKDFINI